jgi:hypothetical protein
MPFACPEQNLNKRTPFYSFGEPRHLTFDVAHGSRSPNAFAGSEAHAEELGSLNAVAGKRIFNFSWLKFKHQQYKVLRKIVEAP